MDIHNYQPKRLQTIHLRSYRPRREQGFVLITVLLVMLLVVVIGIMATSTSTVELEVAAMDKFHEQAFAAGDSGVYLAPKVIGRAMAEMGVPDNPNFSTIAPWFYDEIMGYADPPFPGAPLEPAVVFSLGNDTRVVIDIRRLGQENLAGSAAEFGAGAAQILYSLDARGTGAKKTSSNIVAVYRRIPGTAGGL